MSQTPSPLPYRPSDGEPYPVEPTPAPGGAGPAPTSDSASGRARIEKPGLMEGFDEDADFSSDPELERVVAGKPVTGIPVAVAPPPSLPKTDLVKPMWAWEHIFWASAGAGLLIAALVASGINVPSRLDAQNHALPVTTGMRVLSVILTFYAALLHTGTGVAAVFVAAQLQSKRMGKVEVAAARMFAAVAAFVFLVNLNMTLLPGKFEETVLAALAYAAVVALTFRLFTRDLLMYVVGAHFILWLIVSVGMELTRKQG